MKENKKIYNDYTYRLVELKDELSKTILNIEDVKQQQLLLGDIIKKSEYHDKFSLFLEQSENQIKNLDNQVYILKQRVDLISKALDSIEKNGDVVKEPIFLLLEALGIFKPEEKEN